MIRFVVVGFGRRHGVDCSVIHTECGISERDGMWMNHYYLYNRGVILLCLVSIRSLLTLLLSVFQFYFVWRSFNSKIICVWKLVRCGVAFLFYREKCCVYRISTVPHSALQYIGEWPFCRTRQACSMSRKEAAKKATRLFPLHQQKTLTASGWCKCDLCDCHSSYHYFIPFEY